MIVLMKKVKYQNMRQTNDRKKESIYRVERRERLELVERTESIETEKERTEKG